MSETVTPGVVLKTKFVTANKKGFQDYVQYVDREEVKGKGEAHRSMFSLYNHYMDDPDKTSALFTQQSDYLTLGGKKGIKSLFEQAQKNNSIMWQDVITFDNQWLQKQGVYDPKSHTLDEDIMKQVTRKSMKAMMKKEGLQESATWSAAIHYNTDNIHVHVATVEPNPTRDRGKRKLKTLDAMKGEVVNGLLDRTQERNHINSLIRDHMVNTKKENSSMKWRNRELKPLFLEVYNHLPQDKRQWHYGYQMLNPIRPKIDQITTEYLNKYHPKDMQQLHVKLEQEVDELKKAYGDGPKDKKRYQHYKQNKIDDLYKRMGNAFLQEMKSYDKQITKHQPKSPFSSNKFIPPGIYLQRSLRRIERTMYQTYEEYINDRDHQKLERDIEQEHGR
ncbi:relaxase MobL [Halobacillus shinanisalinarum]|uniref:Relaxase MobL n=1 Tax=Halobacillus shinanisalinarum TaxID=2932258 RepID=A0ABY4H586_9BACI|nr:MobP2 family relaxase [Halobacillus shinanisalinarum]UOQ95075.1 relaxase MobL [Halobacillus shinanisalinarum]